MTRQLNLLFIVMTLLMCTACTQEAPIPSNRAKVTGTLTLDGNPMKGGTITFILPDPPNTKAVGIIRSDGAYTITAAPKGECLVAVETETLKLTDMSSYVEIPRAYARPSASGLTASIPPEGGEFNFELKSKL